MKNRAATSSGKPSRAELLASEGKGLRDVIAPDLKVLFVGINPGLYSGWSGHHFAKPGNRFWPALYASGFTPRLLHPWEKRELLREGLGVSNLVNRATATAEALAPEEFVAGLRRLAAKVRRYRPRIVAFLGMGAYCDAFSIKSTKTGAQAERFEGARLWVLPNPSGLNANYQLGAHAKLLRALRRAAQARATRD